jgi:hypothetical protein
VPEPNEQNQTEQQPLAGKYKTAEDLEAGYREASKTIGVPLPATVRLHGEGGMFADISALEAGYKDLESKIGKIKSPAPATTTASGPPKIDPPPTPPATGTFNDVESILKAANLKPEELSEAWSKNGSLTEQQYAALGKLGYTRGVVDHTMKAEAAAAAAAEITGKQISADAERIAGGADQLKSLLTWGQSLPQARVEDLNRRLANPNLYAGALVELQAEYTKSVGSGNSRPLVSGSGISPATLDAKELNALVDKAKAGDAAARTAIKNFTPEQRRILTINGGK